MKVKLTTLSHLLRFKTWINAALEAIQATIPDLDATEVENATEVTAAAITELNERIKTLEALVRGGDLIEAQKITASREIEAPNLFSGNYNDLSNKPTIPSKTSDLSNDSGFISTETDPTVPSWAKAPSKPGYSFSEIDGTVLASQLPSYVDDVLEYSAQSAFPAEGESGKIYVALDTNLTYRWSGSAYVEISQSLALGETSSTAYRGDRGKTAYDHSQLQSGNPHNVTKSDVGLGNVGNFKAVSTEASQGLSDTEKSNARANIGAGTSSFSGSYSDLSNKPAIPAKTSDIQNDSGFITNAAMKDPSEVAAAALNEHERRIGAVEDILGGEDGVELKSLVVTRELKAPNLHLEVKNIGAQSTAAAILFPSTRRAYVMMTAAANITLNVTADASLPDENYVLLKNTSGSEITVTIGTVNGSGSNILIPEGGIVVPAGMYVEISYIVSSSMTIVSASGALTIKS